MFINEKFESACYYGNINKLKKIDLNDFKKIDDFKKSIEFGLTQATIKGHLEIIKYILTHPELKRHVKIDFYNKIIIRFACNNGHLDVIKYLLTHQDFKNKINIHEHNDSAFRYACAQKFIYILKFLIFEFKIEKTTRIDEFLEYYKDEPFIQDVIKFFKIRDLKSNLEQSLTNNQNTGKPVRNKI